MTSLREYWFVGIDDFSRELYAGIFSGKPPHSAATFLGQVIEEWPYTFLNVPIQAMARNIKAR